jgi:hypothetical protein
MAVKNKPAQKNVRSLESNSWFDRLIYWKKDLLCIAILLGLIYILFFNIITSDMIFSDTGDTAAAHSIGKAFESIKQKEHTDPLWVPFIFSGMPLTGALMFPLDLNYFEMLLQIPGRILFLNIEVFWFVLHYFLMGVFMFALVRQMKFSHLPSLFAAITVMLNPYAIGLVMPNHGSKLVTLSYIPLLFLFAYKLFEKRNLLNLGMLAAVTGTMLLSRHPQIAFYGLLMLGCYMVYEIILEIRKTPVLVMKKALLMLLALGIGFAIYTYEFLPTQEYAVYSIRGGGGDGAATGLSYDYATNWSFHPFEMMNYLVPSFFGFSNPFYWGWMPFTESTVYIGIVPILLSVIALIYRRNRMTWFLLIFSALMLMISFGRHFGLVYNLMFNYFPYFNKFRVPVLILHLMPITLGILAAFGFGVLSDLHNNLKTVDLDKLRKGLIVALGIMGAILLIGLVANEAVYSSLSGIMFTRSDDMQQLRAQYGAQAPQVMEQLKHMRFDLLWKDYIKFAVIAAAGIGLIITYIKRKTTFTTLAAGLIVILIIDLLILDTKFIEPKQKKSLDDHFLPDATVKFLKADTSLYRIFPVGQDLFQDDSYMYHEISSIGGYSPAKLKIYQDIIESALQKGTDPQFPLNMNIINMLNGKYLIAQVRLPENRFTLVNVDQSKQLLTYLNSRSLPRAWFVDSVVVSQSKTETFSILNSASWNPSTTVILEKQPAVKPVRSDSTSASITRYESRIISISTFCSNQSMLVLGESYYPAGWQAFIDGAETEIYKSNYVIRSVIVPSAKHTIEFRFDPPSYKLGIMITNGAWGIALILVLAGLFQIPAVRGRLGIKKKEAGTVVLKEDTSRQ